MHDLIVGFNPLTSNMTALEGCADVLSYEGTVMTQYLFI